MWFTCLFGGAKNEDSRLFSSIVCLLFKMYCYGLSFHLQRPQALGVIIDAASTSANRSDVVYISDTRNCVGTRDKHLQLHTFCVCLSIAFNTTHGMQP